jgi:hypothetical protein
MIHFASWTANLLLFTAIMIPVGAVLTWLLWRRYVAPAQRRLDETRRELHSAGSSPAIPKA